MTARPASGDHHLYRLPARGWLGGVCAGLSQRLTLDLTAVRIIVVILTVGTGGLFALVYAVAWAVMPVAPTEGVGPGSLPGSDASATGAHAAGPTAGAEAAGSWGWLRRQTGPLGAESDEGGWRPRSGAIRIGLGVTFMTLGVLLAFREFGVWWSDGVVWPIVLAAGGAALILRQIQVSGEPAPELKEQTLAKTQAIAPQGQATATATATAGAEALREGAIEGRGENLRGTTPQRGRIRSALRLYRGGFGVAMVLAAATLFLYANGVFGEVGDAALAVLAIAAASGLILAPFLLAAARRAREERRQRIRSEERAEVAAHLHDSVLQTLAMIQRRSGDSAEIATLARRQERELREWLSGRGDEERADSLAAAVERAAAEVEEALQAPVETVTVGDREYDRRGEALVAAMREAITNAVRFAGPVSVFAELSPERATIFVRDRGPGFEPDQIPPDRRGVRESIIGRMERHGGSAKIRSRPGSGEGTEIELSMEFS